MKKIFPVASILFLMACNNAADTKKTETGTTTPTAASTDKPATNNAAGSTIKVTLTGGANAGTYTASSETATCSIGATGPKSFGNQYSVKGKAANEFSSLQLIVDDYESAKSGTKKFYIKVAFGKIVEGNKYEINGSDNSLAGKKQGSGKLTIHESGSTKTATIQGKTADGVTIDATLICSEVIAMPGN